MGKIMKSSTLSAFITEMAIVFILEIITGFILINTHKSPNGSSIDDWIVAFVVPFFIYFPFAHLIRYAFAFRAYKVLYFMYTFFFIVFLGIGLDLIQGSLTTDKLEFLLILIISFVGYTLWIFTLKKKGLFERMAKPEQIKMVYYSLNRKQRFTMVFPDKYVRYLETGDEKYLGDKDGGEN